MLRSRKSITFVILALCFATLLAVSFRQVTAITFTSRESAEANEELSRFVTLPAPAAAVNQPANAGEEAEPNKWAHVVFPEVDFESLAVQNPDIVGWLILEDTVINYPVVQTNNNSFYLTHLFDGTKNANGTLFVDHRNTPGFIDQNTIIYGHHMNNGSMFAPLIQYVDQAFFDAHPYLLFLTPDGNYLIELFAGYTTDVDDSSWQRSFADASEFTSWLTAVKDRSDFQSELMPEPTDHIITLSTCSRDFRGAKYILAGRLIPM